LYGNIKKVLILLGGQRRFCEGIFRTGVRPKRIGGAEGLAVMREVVIAVVAGALIAIIVVAVLVHFLP
jgi:hypothetical protein